MHLENYQIAKWLENVSHLGRNWKTKEKQSWINYNPKKVWKETMVEIFRIIKYNECKRIMFKYRHSFRRHHEEKEIEIHKTKTKTEVENFWRGPA